ncbi:MAG: hypothetical protein ND866_29025, partial [Pyrinomonadaceae bacterium]|nr:hypothetical protein [Pyrinomonadaceae bacterium]
TLELIPPGGRRETLRAALWAADLQLALAQARPTGGLRSTRLYFRRYQYGGNTKQISTVVASAAFAAKL